MCGQQVPRVTVESIIRAGHRGPEVAERQLLFQGSPLRARRIGKYSSSRQSFLAPGHVPPPATGTVFPTCRSALRRRLGSKSSPRSASRAAARRRPLLPGLFRLGTRAQMAVFLR